jgi:DNA-directed RNA polymerase subunit omega
MNPTLVKKALEIVSNSHVLVNLVSRRVRQLNSGGGGANRPLLSDCGNMCASDIALQEIIDGNMGFELPEFVPLTRPTRSGNRPKQWGRA